MQRETILILVTTGCFLVGCNQPAVMLKSPAFQASENTVRDWNDVAQKIAADMRLLGLLPADGRLDPTRITAKPIFIRVQAPDSAFVNMVAKQLEGDILWMGGMVARTPNGATVVNLDVNFVQWSSRGKPPELLGILSAAAALPALLIGDSLPMTTWVAADAVASTTLGFAILADGVVALTPTMNTEVVWEATIVTSEHVLMRLQEPIYIRNADISLYAHTTNLSPITSWATAEPLRGRLTRYTE